MAGRVVAISLIAIDRMSRTFHDAGEQADELADQIDEVGKASDRAFGGARAKALTVFNKGLGGLRTGTATGTKAVLGLGAASAGVFAGMGAGVAGIAAGIAGLGISLALQNKELRQVFTDTFADIKKQAVSLAAPFVGPLKQVAGIIRSTFGAIAPQLKAAFAAVAPAIVPLAQGISGMVKNLSAIFVPLAQVGAKILAGLGPALSQLGSQLVALLRPVLDALNSVGAGLFQTLIGGIGNVLASLGPLLGTLVRVGAQLLGPLLQAINIVVGALVAALIPVLTAIAPVFVQLVGALAPLIAQLVTGLSPILVALAPILGRVFAVLQPVIAALISALQPVLAALVPVIGLVVDAFGRVILALLPLLPPLSQLITSLISGLMPVLSPIITLISQTAATIVGALVQALITAMPALQAIVMGIASLLPALMPIIPLFAQWLTAILPLIGPITQLVVLLTGLLVPIIRVVITVLVKVYTTIFSLIIPVFRLVVTVITWAVGLIRPLFTVIGTALQAVGRRATWLWNNAIGPAFRGIVAAVKAAWGFLQPIFRVIATILKVVVAAAFVLLRTTVKAVWIAIQIAIKVAWAIIRPIWNAIRNHLAGPLSAAFRGFRNLIGTLWSGIRNSISTATNVIKTIFNGLKIAVGRVRDAFKTAVDGIKRIWDRLKGIAKTPVNFVIGLYNKGIVSLVNRLAGFAGVKDRLSPIGYFARGGTLDNPAAAAPMMTNGPMAIVGEGRRQHPEYVIPTDPAHRGRAQALWAKAGQDLGGPPARKWLTGSNALAGEGLGFAGGGSLQALGFGGIIGKFVKDFTLGNVEKAAKGLLGKILGGGVPGSGLFRDLISKIPGWIKNSILGWIKNKVGAGGPGVKRALTFARSQAGKPYVWGGVGPGGYDCSGFMSAITNVVKGRRPYSRLFTTHGFTGPRGPAGFVRGARSGFTVGITHSGVGHMAGTLGGVNVESSGSAGVRVGGGARGTGSGMFSTRYGLRMDNGGVLPPRSLSLIRNATSRSELVLNGAQQDLLSGGAPVVLEIRSGGSRFDDALVEVLRKAIRVRGGGDVQVVLGS